MEEVTTGKDAKSEPCRISTGKSLWRRTKMEKRGKEKSLFTVFGLRKGRAGAPTHPGGAQCTKFLFSQGHVSFKVLSSLPKNK